jgi:hypothetical protein
MDNWDLFSGAPVYRPETPAQQHARVDRWHKDAMVRQANLRAYEQGKPIYLEGYGQVENPAAAEPKVSAEEQAYQYACMDAERARTAADKHKEECEIAAYNSGQERKSRRKLCHECLGSEHAAKTAEQRVATLAKERTKQNGY